MNQEQLTAEVIALQKSVLEMRQGVAVVETNIKAAFKRIDELKTLTDSVHKLALSVERQTGELARLTEKHAALQADCTTNGQV